jgi:hypothetical protein
MWNFISQRRVYKKLRIWKNSATVESLYAPLGFGNVVWMCKECGRSLLKLGHCVRKLSLYRLQQSACIFQTDYEQSFSSWISTVLLDRHYQVTSFSNGLTENQRCLFLCRQASLEAPALNPFVQGPDHGAYFAFRRTVFVKQADNRLLECKPPHPPGSD